MLPIEYQPISAQAFIAAREADGWPTSVAKFLSGWGNAIDKGAFDQSSHTLEKLLGRKPKDLEGMLRVAFSL
jgi:NAD(P)H dehydrogenase (quinone)